MRAASAGRRRRRGACGCPRAAGRGRSVVELALELLDGAAREPRADARMIRASACDSSAAWRPRIATRPGKPANAGRPLERRARAGSSAWTRRARGRAQPIAQPIDAAAELVLRATRPAPPPPTASARGRSATKSAIVTSVSWPTAEMTGTGDARDRARDDLFVERPEILDRAAAAADDDDVDAGHARDRPAAPRAISSAAPSPCTRAGPNDEVRVRVAAAQHLDDVANRRAVERGDDADLARQRRQRPLARRVEQPFRLQPLLQLIERELQRAEARAARGARRRADTRPSARRPRSCPRATTRRPSAGLNFR